MLRGRASIAGRAPHPEIVDIVLAAAARVYWTRANDAVGHEPSEAFLERVQALLGEEVFRTLMVWRRFGTGRDAHG
jgi:hypothetical protein